MAGSNTSRRAAYWRACALRVAIPAVLFAAVLVGVIAVALYKTPQQQKWLLDREYPEWRRL